MSNYFSPSHSPFPGTNHIGLTRSRFYSSYYSGASQASNNMKVLYSLMGVNLAVFGYAMYVKAQAQSGFPGPYMTFMRNMSCNLTDVLKNGTWWTLLTSAFTHVDVWHLAANMFTAYYLGQFLCYAPVITPVRFLTIAIGSGLTGSVGYIYQRYLKTGGLGRDSTRGLGFSGALMGITSVAACLAPTAKVYIYGILPLPLWATVAGYAFYDGYYLNDNNSRIGHAGHLGGLAFGIAYYLLKLRGLRF
jgi:membrane associated rhomboid family serine protease